jgi:tetratricopeptide (TPR) repeat protein
VFRNSLTRAAFLLTAWRGNLYLDFFDTVPLKYLFLWTWRDWVCSVSGKILSRKDLDLKSYGIRTYFQKAIDLEPDYSAAWSGLADSHTGSVAEGKFSPDAVMPQAEAAARKAMEPDDSDDEAHRAAAAIQFFYRWDWEAADREAARAVELNPNFGENHHLRAYVLSALNRTDESLQEDRKAMELDPVVRPWELGYSLLRARQFDAAVNELRIRSEARPTDAWLHGVLSEAYLHKGMEREAEQEAEQSMRLSGDQQLADEQLNDAFAWLEKAYEESGP